MKFSELLEKLSIKNSEIRDFEISSLTIDSRTAIENSINIDELSII